MQEQALVSDRLANRVDRLLNGEYQSSLPWKTASVLLRGNERKLAFAAILFFIKQAPVWFLPLATKHIIDAISKPTTSNSHDLSIWGSFAALCLAQNIPMHTWYSWVMSSIVRTMQRDLRSALVVRLQQLSVSFHDEMEGGRLQAKVLRDVDNIGGLFTGVTDTILTVTITSVAALTIALIQAPSVALFFLLAVPMAVGLMRLFRSALATRNTAFRKDMEGVSVRVTEMIDMLPVTRAHAAEYRETARIRRQLARITASGRRLDTTTNRFQSSAWVTFNAFQLICLLFCAIQVRHGQLSIGQLVMFQSYFGLLIGNIAGALGLLPQLTAGAESIRSIGEVLESPDLEGDGKHLVRTVRGELEFKHVNYQYPTANRPAIADFSLKVAPGECVALVGESGSGKSTILNLIIGFRRPTSGQMLLDGVDMADVNLRSFREHLAIVPQNTILFSGTVRENITYGIDNVKESRLTEALERANCTEFVRRLPNGLATMIGPRGGKLSGGQRQRIAIARALLRDPRMLILDEATSALDALSEHLVQEAINELIVGRTTIIIAHRLATLRHADRIVVLDQGRMIEQGSWNELLQRPGSAFSIAYSMQINAARRESEQLAA